MVTDRRRTRRARRNRSRRNGEGAAEVIHNSADLERVLAGQAEGGPPPAFATASEQTWLEMIADRLESEFAAVGANGSSTMSTEGSLRQELVINPDETITEPYQVAAGSPGAGFSTSWPGSDVVMTLRSPSGRVIDRSTVAADVVHQVAPTQELYYVKNPEEGEWTIELFGADLTEEQDSRL